MFNFESKTKKEDIEFSLDLYQRVLSTLKDYNYEINSTEAVVLRDEIEKIVQENKKIIDDYIKTNIASPDLLTDKKLEVIYRLFWNLYNIDIRSYIDFTKKEFQEDALKDLFKYIKEKIRKDTELM